jgi:uncharacterized protein YciI
MIALVLAFTPGATARLPLRPAHREQLTALHAEGKLVAAGPYADESGALLLFSAEREEVEAAVAADPYYQAPGVTVVTIAEWSPVVGSVS